MVEKSRDKLSCRQSDEQSMPIKSAYTDQQLIICLSSEPLPSSKQSNSFIKQSFAINRANSCKDKNLKRSYDVTDRDWNLIFV